MQGARGLPSDFLLDAEQYRVLDWARARGVLPAGYVVLPPAAARRIATRALEQGGAAWWTLRELSAWSERRPSEALRAPALVLSSLAQRFGANGPHGLTLLWKVREPQVGPPPLFRVPTQRTSEPVKLPTLHHLELELLDQEQEPYPRVGLEIDTPDGVTHAAQTDRYGYHFLDRLDSGGTCQVRAAPGPDPEALDGDWVGVALTYHDGSPVAGAAYTATPSGGPAQQGTLDESGCATLLGVAGSCKLSFPELETPSEDLLAGVDLEPGLVTHLIARRPTLCHRIRGFLFDTDKSFLLPDGLPVMAQVRADYEQYPEYDVHIVGHTDTTGTPDYNRTLSKERAEAMAAFLRDDDGAWLAWYGSGKPEKKRWGRREDVLMIGALPDGPGLVAGSDPIGAYQQARGMAQSGSADQATRRALIKEYMAIDQTPLPAGTKIATEGKGEDEPLVQSGDSVAEGQNRRVEVFFCEPGKPPPPKPKPKKETEVAPTPKGALRELRLIDTEGENESQLREAIQNEILEIVPAPQTGRNRIVVQLTAEPPVAAEPTWEVSGDATKSGTTMFIVTPPPSSGWNPKAKPKVHVVIAEVPEMNQMTATVHVYPNDEHSVGVDFDKPAEWKDIVETIAKVIDFIGGDFKLKLPRGKWSLKSRFREYHDKRAFYWFELIAHMDPLLEFEQAKLTLGPDKILKLAKKLAKRLPGKLAKKLEQFLDKVVQAHGYVSIEGSSALDVMMVRTSPGQAMHSVQNQGEGVTGTPTLKLGMKLGLWDDPKDDKDKPLIAIDAHGSASLPVTADVFVDEKGWGIVLSVRMTELKVEGSAKFWKLDPEKIEGVLMDAPEGPIYGPKKFYLADF
ncbi:MAG TPA: OmpA family protein [Polyangiales bacterium]|nr:OmpA family protein [Polyangiales bacterium]